MGPDGDCVLEAINFRLHQKLRTQEAGITKNPPANKQDNNSEFLEVSGAAVQETSQAYRWFQVCEPWYPMPREGYTGASTRPVLCLLAAAWCQRDGVGGGTFCLFLFYNIFSQLRTLCNSGYVPNKLLNKKKKWTLSSALSFFSHFEQIF